MLNGKCCMMNDKCCMNVHAVQTVTYQFCLYFTMKEKWFTIEKNIYLRKPFAMNEKTIHEGRNVKRIREILGIKQDALAMELGLSQQAISALEQKEKLDEKILVDVAKSLKISPEAIKSFNEEAAVNYISTFTENSVNNGAVYAFNSTINPIEKLIETMEENKKLLQSLLKEKDEKIALLEKMIEKK